MVVVIGEILFDIFPDYQRIGGAPFNFAYHLKQLGQEVRFFSRVGNDKPGMEILEILKSHGFSPDDIQIDKKHPAGSVNISMDENGIPVYEIVKNVAYDYFVWNETLDSALASARMLYFGSLAQRSAQAFVQYQKIFYRKDPKSIGFYDINLRPRSYSPEIIHQSLGYTDILKLSLEEWETIEKIYATGDRDFNAFQNFLFHNFPIKMIIITKGSRGSEVIQPDGHFLVDAITVPEVVDTVGAGDAYAAVFAHGILSGWGLRETSQRASRFASLVCTFPGALPSDLSVYKEIMKGN